MDVLDTTIVKKVVPAEASFCPAWAEELDEFRHVNSGAEDLYVNDKAPIYVVSNETWQSSTIDRLVKNDDKAGGNTQFCIGGLSNLYLFVLTKCEYLVNIDPAPGQAQLWHLFCQAVQETSTAHECVSLFLRRFAETEFKGCKQDREEEFLSLERFFLTGHSPFLVDGGYKKIKDAVTKGNIQSFCLNFNNPDRVLKFSSLLGKKGLTAHCVYASNLNADHWSKFVAPETLIRSIQNLALPAKGHNVHFLFCAPSLFETCSCKRKSLRMITTNHFREFSGIMCVKGIHHLLVFLDRLEKDFCVLFLAKYQKILTISHPVYMEKYVTHIKRRASFHYFDTQFRELVKTKKLPALTEALRIYNLLYELTLVELELEGIKEKVFLHGLRSQHPEAATAYQGAPAEEKALVPESIFIIKHVFDRIRTLLIENY